MDLTAASASVRICGWLTARSVLTIEENAVIGGAGAEVSRVVDTLSQRPRVLRLGLPDKFIDHGDQAKLLASAGLDEAGILASINALNQRDS